MKAAARRSAAILAALLAFAAPAQSAVSDQRASSASRGAGWIVDQQSGDGQFFKPGTGADQKAPATADALVAVVSGRVTGEPVDKAVTYIKARGMSDADTGPHTGQIILGLVAAGRNPSDLDGLNYSSKLDSYYNSSTGAWDSSSVYGDALAALAYSAIHGTLPQAAVDFLENRQCADHGWSFDAACQYGSDTNSTSVVLMALIAGKVPSSDGAVVSGRKYLLDAQNQAGGFGYSPGSDTDANSTGLVLSAVAALGEDAQASPWRQSDGDDAVKALAALQTATGAFAYQAGGGDNSFATVQAVPGMAALAYPVGPQQAPAPPSPSPVPSSGGGPNTQTAGTTSTYQTRINTPVSFAGPGFASGATVTAELRSNPVALGTYTADSSGVVRFTFAVPTTTPAGIHTIVATGPSASGGTNVASAQILVVPAGLPVTGDAPPGATVMPAPALGILGAAGLTWLIRRRTRCAA